MVTYTYVHHQFTLLDYNELRPRYIIPIKRISRARYDQALAELRSGKKRKMVEMLQDVNEALENFEKRITNKPNGRKI